MRKFPFSASTRIGFIHSEEKNEPEEVWQCAILVTVTFEALITRVIRSEGSAVKVPQSRFRSEGSAVKVPQ